MFVASANVVAYVEGGYGRCQLHAPLILIIHPGLRDLTSICILAVCYSCSLTYWIQQVFTRWLPLSGLPWITACSAWVSYYSSIIPKALFPSSSISMDNMDILNSWMYWVLWLRAHDFKQISSLLFVYLKMSHCWIDVHAVQHGFTKMWRYFHKQYYSELSEPKLTLIMLLLAF